MKIYDVIGIGANLTGSFSGSFKGLFTGPLDGVAATSSYVEYSNVANKPTLVSGSSQISYSGITDKPSGIVSGSSQVTYSGLSGIPNGIVSGSSQVLGFNVFATTGSNQFNGSQAITGSLTVTGQVIAQTLNVQQVTSSIVFSSGSNRFGNNSGNTHSFTGSVRISGSLTVNGSGLVPYTGATQEVNLGVYSISANSVLANQITVNPSGTTAAQVFLKHGSSFSLPNGFGSIGSSTGNEFRLYQVSSGGVFKGANISLNSITASATRTYTLPDADGTIALTSNLGAYLPLAGGTLTGALNGTSAVFSSTNQSLGGSYSTTGNLLISSSDSFAINKGGSLSLGGKYNSAGTPIETFARIHGKKENSNDGDTAGYLAFETVPDATALLTERMRINSAGNVGIGTNAPNAKLTVWTPSTTGLQVALRLNNPFGFANVDTGAQIVFSQDRSTAENLVQGIIAVGQQDAGTSATSYMSFSTNNTGVAERMRITSNGNIGFGVTPAAWSVNANYTGYQFKNASLYVRTSSPELYINNNSYYNGTNWKYLMGAPAAKFELVNNEFLFSNVVSGTADANITWVDRMLISSTGAVTKPSQPAWSVGLSSTQTISSPTIIAWNQSSGNDCFIQGGVTLNGDNGRVTVPVAGKYMLFASIRTEDPGAVFGTNLNIRRNGTTILRHYVGGAVNSAGSYMYIETRPVIINCAANDYIDFNFDTVPGTFQISASTNTVVRFGGFLMG